MKVLDFVIPNVLFALILLFFCLFYCFCHIGIDLTIQV